MMLLHAVVQTVLTGSEDAGIATLYFFVAFFISLWFGCKNQESDESKEMKAAMEAASAYGDVVLRADNDKGNLTDYLGVFELQVAIAQGRPTYRRKPMTVKGKPVYLFYYAGTWYVGSDRKVNSGWWQATSDARIPSQITSSSWQFFDGTGLVYASVTITPTSRITPTSLIMV